MARTYGGQTMWAPLRRVLVKRPEAAFAVADPALWHYASRPDLAAAQREHDGLAAQLRDAGAEVIYAEEPQPERADAIFTFDPALVTDAGAILLAMGKTLRQGEEEALGRALETAGVPVYARLRGEARAEGGDLLWVDEHTLAVGQGFRTNAEGLRQLGEALEPLGVSVLPVALPYYTGPEACLHLLSLISIVDQRLAVVYLPLLAVSFVRELERRGFQLVAVPDAEFATMGPNVLALAPRDCLMLQGNPITRQRLEDAGCRVRTYRGDEISLKAEGGPTCLTRPLLRE
ncbi:MAG: dimethylarginine dimethylaminohydrolase family protein [Ktedonobacterales bacterium]